ncbi:DUF2283 domain-containing protein [Leptothermofonsia sichuanensis E412]|uniref:DUF2283 domain-containing protein n=1 Tax=Leptothermofonsia sichuanensis TaxID=2917832 RepID=UPI001CA74FB3|nr:DUF2283 domain-containing protein [Leptothermofonsia sichuanensis]QZZ21270.1 DUF2283 domain-containing protein [Leptothermofonsia sichuanensis E412]
MAERVKVWFDPEADFLEVIFSDALGYMRETENDAVMERVDLDGNLLGFSILAISQLAKSKPLMAELLSGRGSVA